MQSELYRYITAVWMLGGLVWLAGWLISKPTVRAQSAGSRALHILLIVIAYYLIFTSHLRFGPLALRFVPQSLAVAWIGLAFTVAGVAFAIWARIYIGRNWSATVTIKKDHALVRTGPYGLVRHPIYSGFAFATVGTALAVGEFRALLGAAIALLGFRMKSRMEESFMTDQFGTQYTDYKRDVKALIPFIW